LVSANGQYRTVTYVSPTSLTVPLTAADVANPGAFQVLVENFPTGSTGCAVFGYQTFLVEGKGPTLAAPVFTPPAGGYTTPQSVTIKDALAAATIHYTTNGTTPTTASPVYSTPITVSATETLKAEAVATGYVTSPVATAGYSIQPYAAIPTISPKGGTYSTAQSVTLSDATPGATIYYTTDGTTPSTSSPVYSPGTPITVSSTETVKADARATGYFRSVVASATYTIVP
jgi:hypothetical protein